MSKLILHIFPEMWHLLFAARVRISGFKSYAKITIIIDKKCVSISHDGFCVLFLFISGNNCSHMYVLPNIAHIWYANSTVFWSQSLEKRVKIWYTNLTKLLFQLIPFEVHLPFLHQK
jgi:hypothetical protein